MSHELNSFRISLSNTEVVETYSFDKTKSMVTSKALHTSIKVCKEIFTLLFSILQTKQNQKWEICNLYEVIV